MPWEQMTVQQRREEFAVLAQQEGSNISQLCERFGISRKTGYKWLKRKAEGKELTDQSRRPHHSPRKSGAAIEEAVVALRQEHPAWGGRKISKLIEQDKERALAPSTVTKILHRHDLIDQSASEAASAWHRFEHEEPNSLWQMDFKGHFGVGDQRCHPLTVIDDHSRYNVVLQACRDERRETVEAILWRAFAQYGLPLRINTDNGAPWGTAGQGPLSTLVVNLIRLGIKVSHSRPRHPQTNGKDERFHRTLKAEVLAHRHFASFDLVQPEFDRWRQIYNAKRPHEALSMQTPMTRYRPSPRSLPSTLPPIEYAPDDLVRKVQNGGWVNFKGREFRLSKALVGQYIAFRPDLSDDGKYELYFCHKQIDSIHLTSLT